MCTTGPSTLRLSAAAAAGWVLFAIGTPWAGAAPATDEQGFVGSTARCATPTVAVSFGSTATSRVAIASLLAVSSSTAGCGSRTAPG